MSQAFLDSARQAHDAVLGLIKACRECESRAFDALHEPEAFEWAHKVDVLQELVDKGVL